jgi:AcrR family transcriptional regulator
MFNQRERDDDYIIKTSEELFFKSGINNVTIEDIAKKSGYGAATIYRHFKNKTNILIKCAIDVWTTLFNKYYAPSSEFVRGIDGVRFFFSIFDSILDNNRDAARFITEFDSYLMTNKINPRELKDYDDVLLKVKAFFDKEYARGLADETIRKDLDRDVYYFAVNRALFMLVEKLTSGPIVKSDKLIDEKPQVDLIIDMAINYIKNVK